MCVLPFAAESRGRLETLQPADRAMRSSGVVLTASVHTFQLSRCTEFSEVCFQRYAILEAIPNLKIGFF
jgi:hypothetical protein